MVIRFNFNIHLNQKVYAKTKYIHGLMIHLITYNY